jgi:Glycosyl transferases group 1
VRVLFWPNHGSYASAFFQGAHEYLVPWAPEGGPFASGRGGYDDFWPASVVEVPVEALRNQPVDIVVLQRLEELELAERWLGRRPGRDVPALYLEHNTPRGDVTGMVHPLADRTDLLIVHVTHFNAAFWDTGRAPITVVEHGVVDPGHRYTGELPHLGVTINEPARRRRVTGADLLPRFARAGHIDLFGIDGDLLGPAIGLGSEALTWVGDIPMSRMQPMLAERRVYLHPNRWTSLGLSLLEAMHLGMPVVAFASTEALRAVPPEVGVLSTDVEALVAGAARLLADPEEARRRGDAARAVVLERYGLPRFLAAWDQVLGDVVERGGRSAPA